MNNSNQHQTKVIFGVFFALLVMLIAGCKKEFDSPPIKTIPEGNLLTIAQIRDMYVPGKNYKFSGDTSVYCVVTASEESGNIYRAAYVWDGTAAIEVRLMASGGLYEGDSIRINLKDVTLGDYQGMLQLDSVDADLNIVKIATNQTIRPQKLEKVTDINTLVQGQFVELDNVQFAVGEIGSTYADAVNQQSVNRMLEDCDGNQVIVRSSGYSNFAAQTVAEGKGKFRGIVSEFGGDMQLLIRNVTDLEMNDERCGPFFSKTFTDGSLTSGGWSVQSPVGDLDWEADDRDGDYYAEMSNYDFNNDTNYAAEAWLISPKIDLTEALNPVLTFRSMKRYSGTGLQLKISTTYTGDVLDAANNWTTLFAVYDNDDSSWSFVDSEDVPIVNYKSAETVIAFKYLGTTSNGATWRVTDIKIEDK